MQKRRTASRILRLAAAALLALAVAVLAVRLVGVRLNRRTPRGGINESLYVDINGSKQWINIYGQNTDNPVLLYLHGGPGSATSPIDHAFTRLWSDVYTVVTWDQRNCGKSYDPRDTSPITGEILLDDGRAMTEFLRERLAKEKITLLGHSWGSMLGANLALAYPEYYEAFIGTGQYIDPDENEKRLREAAAGWVGDDAEGLRLLEGLDYSQGITLEYALACNEIMERYGYGVMKDGTDYSLVLALLCNPNYSLADYARFLATLQSQRDCYFEFIPFGMRELSLLGRHEYLVPFYNINGDMDYQTSYSLACEYFERVSAPRKKMYVMRSATHGLLESRSGEFSAILHEIAADLLATG